MSVSVVENLPVAEQQAGSRGGRLIAVCRVGDIPLGLGRAFVIGGHDIALFRLRHGGIAAVANRCPHKGGPLADGMIAGNQIVCPMHAFRFDLSSGDCDQGGTCPVETYPVEVRGTTVFVSVPLAE
jgi:nitrite reductase (NADH) small subunit